MGIVGESAEPLSISDISKLLYRRVKGFHILLALEEVGAHVEYLYNHGRLAVANLEAIELEENPAILYRTAG